MVNALSKYAGEPLAFTFDDYTIQKIPKGVATEFIEKYHYSGGCGNAIMPWGLYEGVNNRLVGVIAFHTPISENTRASVFEDISESAEVQADLCECRHFDEEHGGREHVTELHRLALHPDCPSNTGSWFITRALNRLKAYKPQYWAAISFADTTEGHDGTVYQACSADYYGTAGKTTFYRDGEGVLRSPRQNGDNITRSEARKRGWETVKRDEKHRYVFWLPDPYQSKAELREQSQIDIQSYPE